MRDCCMPCRPIGNEAACVVPGRARARCHGGCPPSPRTQAADRARRRPGGPWSSHRLVSGRCPGTRAPLSTRGMLVGAVRRAVNALPFRIDVGLQRGEQLVPSPLLRPPIESIEDRLPWSKLVGQVPPRRTRAAPPHDRLEEAPVIMTRSSQTRLRRQNRRYSPPLLVSDPASCRHRDVRSRRLPGRNFPTCERRSRSNGRPSAFRDTP